MYGLTLSEIARQLGIKRDAVEKRLRKLEIKPVCREVLYDPSVVDAIRDVRMGRPPKTKDAKE
jgi:predicted ArsR family transcriptional regulator